MSRFKDEGKSLFHFTDEFLVECPKCKKGCKVLPKVASHDTTPLLFQTRNISCHHCGFNMESKPGIVNTKELHDSYFGYKLWLQTPCCSDVLWAYNERHLQWLEDYVAATQREEVPNINRSMASRLPAWIKESSKRNQVLKAIERLRKKLAKFDSSAG